MKCSNEHFHGPDVQLISCLETKAGLKSKAQETQDITHHIIGQRVMVLTEGAAAKLPRLESLKRTIRRQRQSTTNFRPQPATLEDLQIPDEYQRTNKGDLFLLFDSGPETQRILIFGTHTNTEMLVASQSWLADGTFKTAPPLFSQVHAIHSLRGGPNPLEDGHLLPSLFVLLPNKTEAIYMIMWLQIQILCPNAQPTHMLMDFEKAAINSSQHFWPNANVNGCFFTLLKIFGERYKQKGCKEIIIITNEDLDLRIRYLPALAFVPPLDVNDYFDSVVEQLPMPAAQGLILYFERTYIGRRLPGGFYQEPILPIEKWYLKVYRELLMPWKHGIAHTMQPLDVVIQTYAVL